MSCLLAFDTSTEFGSVALVTPSGLITRFDKLGNTHSEYMLPWIDEVLQEAGIKGKDLDGIVFGAGPGSFTGIRIGITIAKTIAWALNIKITPISGLTAMAISCDKNSYKMPLIDARRGYVYGAIYDKNNKTCIEDSHIYLQDLLDKSKDLTDVVVITNNDIDIKYEKESYNPDILKIVKHYENSEGINPHLVNPIYLKKTEAEEKAGL